MNKNTFAVLAALLMIAVLSGCATSGPEYERSAFHRLVKAIDNDHPVREGIIANSREYPVYVSIDGGAAERISQKYYGFFSVTAKEPHRLVVTDGTGKVLRDQNFSVDDTPLGSAFYMPRGKIIDTGWVIRI